MELTLAENIRSFRKARNLTQEQLSEVLNVTTGAVYKWEAGLSVPELNLIVEMADFFDTSVDVLLGYRMKDNRREATLARLGQLAKNGDPEALAEAEKALKKYPNSFEIVHACAQLYRIFGGGKGGRTKLRRAVELFEQARLLIGQNTDPRISEYTVLAVIGGTLILLGEEEKGLELMKKNNMGGFFSGDIGASLAIFLDRPEEAETYLAEAFADSVANLNNAAFSYAFLYRSRGDNASARAIIDWTQALLQGFFQEAPSAFLDKEMTYAEIMRASLDLAEGRREAAQAALKKAAEYAGRFDKAPDYGLRQIGFAKFEEETAFWDSLGVTARESVETLLRLLKDKELETMWKEITEDE